MNCKRVAARRAFFLTLTLSTAQAQANAVCGKLPTQCAVVSASIGLMRFPPNNVLYCMASDRLTSGLENVWMYCFKAGSIRAR